VQALKLKLLTALLSIIVLASLCITSIAASTGLDEGCRSVDPDGKVTEVIFPGIEVSYRPSIETSFPVERWAKNGIEVRNIGNEPVTLTFHVSAESGDIVVSDISPFPQPYTLYLDPGENQTIWYFIDGSYRSCGVLERGGGEVTVRVRIEKDGESAEIVITHLLLVVPEDQLEPNSVVEGYVKDLGGNPVLDAEVELEGANGPRYFTTTDHDGYFRVEVYAMRYGDTGELHGYNLRVRAPGFKEFNKAIFPEVGETLTVDVTLKPLVEVAEYELVTKVETSGYPIWIARLSADERFIVFGNGHYEEAEMEIGLPDHGVYFLSTNGSIIWSYLTSDQVWGVDVSSDGSYVAAAFLREGVVRLFDRQGNVLWIFPSEESREVKISHDSRYVAIGNTWGDLILVDLESGMEIWRTFLCGQVRWIVFTEDDSLIYAGAGDGYLYKVRVSDGEILGRAYVEAWPFHYGIALSEDEGLIATASKIGRIYLVNASTMEPLWSFDTRGACHWVDVEPNGKFVLIGSGGSYGRMLMYSNGSIAWFGPVSSCGCIIDSNHVAIAENSIEIRDVEGSLLWNFEDLDGSVGFLQFSKDRSKIYVVTNKATLYVFQGGFHSVEESEGVPGGFEEIFADVNFDGVVNEVDLEILMASYGARAGEPGFVAEADLNGDGIVNIVDLAILASCFPL